MPLVDYSSSDDDDQPTVDLSSTSSDDKHNNNVAAALTSSALPPLPSKFHDLYASTVRSSTRDDPSLHGGRKRASPHVEGNWPTHVYVEWYPSNAESAILSSLISKLTDSIKHVEIPCDGSQINSLLVSELGSPLPLHISLSRPIGFLTEKKDDFAASLENGLKASGVRPFSSKLENLKWVPNFDKTSHFLVLGVQPPPLNELNKLLHVTNMVVQDHGQPPLYSIPTAPKAVESRPTKRRRSSATNRLDWGEMQNRSEAFHFSIAWTLKAPSGELKSLTERVAKESQDDIGKIIIGIAEVKNKVGNVVHSIGLARQEIEGSLFGL